MLITTLPKTTPIAGIDGSLLRQNIDLSETPVERLHAGLVASDMYDTLQAPDVDAVLFYLTNQAVARVSSRRSMFEPVTGNDADVIEVYNHLSTIIARRLYYYVACICIREARHCKTCIYGSMDPKGAKIATHLRKRFPSMKAKTAEKLAEMFVQRSKTFTNSMQQLAVFGEDEDMTVAVLAECCYSLYEHYAWSGNYGGKKWAVIAKAWCELASGKWSLELFADTAFTLAHNTAPIFNKGMLYKQPGPRFIELLDCQRAGQLAQWFDSSNLVVPGDWIDIMKAAMPEDFDGEVDWQTVTDLGAVGNYASKLPPPTPKNWVKIDAALSLEAIEKEREDA